MLKTNSSKKKVLECLAYNISRHSLVECWYVFEELKPQGMKLYSRRIRKIKKAVEDDEKLKTQIKKIREKMKKSASVREKQPIKHTDNSMNSMKTELMNA